MRVYVIQHVPFEGPARIADWAASRGHSLSAIPAQDAARLSLDPADLLVVMGGPMGVYDTAEHPWLTAEKDAIARAIHGGTAVLGICLGAQLVAHVLGAEVGRNPEPEIGWFPVTLTEAGMRSRVFGALPVEFIAGHWHGDTFEIPPRAVRLASSAACANQAFEYDGGRVAGVQFHLEWDRIALATLVEHAGTDLMPSAWVQTEDELLGDEAAFDGSGRLLETLLDAVVDAHGV